MSADASPVFGSSAQPAWVPDEARRDRSRLLKAARSWGHRDVEELHRAAIDDPEWFWGAVAADLDLSFSTPYTQVRDRSDGKPFPRWFVGGRLNAAHLCARRHADGPLADKPAVVFEGDDGRVRSLTYAELSAEVEWFAAALRSRGVKQGDRVVLFLPVVPEAVVAFLACAWLGAIAVPAFTGYGSEALATRLRDSEAVVLVTADSTTRRGKPVHLKATADEAAEAAPTVGTVVVVRHSGATVDMRPGRDVYYDELDQQAEVFAPIEVESNHPLTIIYTSGTTGAPKGIVHSHAGFALKAGLDFAYAFDVHEDDVIAWIADMGWMLGPLMIMGGLQLGATIVLVEGLPNYPTRDRVWEIADRHGVTVQGIAPTAARGLMAAADGPPVIGDQLRTFASTGEAWDPPTWQWLFAEVGRSKRPVVNYSGGTEVGGGILVSYPFLPADAASFNGPLLGMDVAVADPEGQPVTGAVGELVVHNTWPGMTHAFWGDRDRYLATYWSRWPDVWLHGDLASLDEHGAWRIHGRSDDTIKVSGRRVGPAELEAALLKDPRIVEAAVIGVPDPQRGQRVVAFAVLKPGAESDESDIRVAAERNVGRSFAPTLHLVAQLPKTKNGKIMRRAIKAQHLGDAHGDMSSLDPATPLDSIPVLDSAHR